jgi:hypothetical protein
MEYELTESGKPLGRFPNLDEAEAHGSGVAEDRGQGVRWQRVFDRGSHGICTDREGHQVTILTIRRVDD